jgi:serine/threonine protein kinase
MAHPPDSAEDDPAAVPWLAPAPPSGPRTSKHAMGSHNALPVGTRLHEFEILGLVGEGGFGIVYLAQDHSLGRRVALKEYMPASLASRDRDTTAVCVRSHRHTDTFDLGLRSFVNEARLLARFDHPALLKVFRFWEANDTAYMAMPYYEGQTLRALLDAPDAVAPDEAWIRHLLSPIMDALALMHASHCYHRDVAPDNILLQPNGQPVLLDFGAARHVLGDATQALTVILKAGFAPIEQYAQGTGVDQGPWTDIYALGAVVVFLITGRPPPPSVARIVHDDYLPLAHVAAGRYSPGFLLGIDRCLQVRGGERPQSIADMRACLDMQPPAPNATDSGVQTVSRLPPTCREVSPPAADDDTTVVLKGEVQPPPASPPRPPHARPAAPARVTFTAKSQGRRGPSVQHVAVASFLVAVSVAAIVVMVWPPTPHPTLTSGTKAWPAEPTAAGPQASSFPLSALPSEPLEPAVQRAELEKNVAVPAVPSRSPAPERSEAPPMAPVTTVGLPQEPARPAKPRASRPARAPLSAGSTPSPSPEAKARAPVQDPEHADDRRRVEEQNRQLDQLLESK